MLLTLWNCHILQISLFLPLSGYCKVEFPNENDQKAQDNNNRNVA